MQNLTDLEGAALGLVWQSRACTAYAIRRHFGSSPSAVFSDSAGTVYPMVQRLARRGWLSKQAERQGRRKATLYALTAAGTAALRRWMEVPQAPGDLVTWDPLRTRALHLGLLDPARRLAWLERAENVLEAHAEGIRRLDRERGPEDLWEHLAHRNVLLQASARLKWIREIRAALGG